MSTVIAILGGVIALLLSLLGWQGTRIRQEKEKRKSAEKTAEKHTLEMERIRDAQKEIEEIRKEEAPEAIPAPSSASERLNRLNGMRDNGDS